MGGGDKLFHRRRAKLKAALLRQAARKSPYDMVLIVCEGEKTEPQYFQALIDDLQLNTANIKILKNTAGSAPRTIVDFALKEYRKEREIDRVYCVFDKDCHTSYTEALDIIHRARMAKGHTIIATTSVPCFEFWLLLHFVYTTKSFDTGTGSICDRVIAELRKQLPTYAKGDSNIFSATKDRVNKAIANAKKITAHCKSAGTDMPSTSVHELVEYLQALKK